MNKRILRKEQIHEGNLALINASHPFQAPKVEALRPTDLRYPDVLLKREAASVLAHSLEKLRARRSIVPVSGYRSYQEQTRIYDQALKDHGESFTKKYVARPGCSEHQSGLAIDLGLYAEHIDDLCPDFPYEGICNDFREFASQVGFVQRYREDKEAITGIAHEPWHFRYVGYPHSKIMQDEQLSLEEYVDYIKEFTGEKKLIFQHDKGVKAAIFFQRIQGEKVSLAIPENKLYQISGNNVDGFIITLWHGN